MRLGATLVPFQRLAVSRLAGSRWFVVKGSDDKGQTTSVFTCYNLQSNLKRLLIYRFYRCSCVSGPLYQQERGWTISFRINRSILEIVKNSLVIFFSSDLKVTATGWQIFDVFSQYKTKIYIYIYIL